MQGRMLRGLRYVQRFIDRSWYPPLLGFLCAVDLVVLVVPLDPLLLSSCLVRPRRWWRIFLSMTTGAVLGAYAAGTLFDLDPTLIQRHFAHVFASPTWHATQEHLRRHGTAGMILLGLSPAPQVFPVLVGALAGIPAFEVAGMLGIGRALKYGCYTFLAAHAPDVLRRVPFLRKTMDQLRDGDAAGSEAVIG